MNGKLVVKLSENESKSSPYRRNRSCLLTTTTVRFDCRWAVNIGITKASSSECWYSVDVLFKKTSRSVVRQWSSIAEVDALLFESASGNARKLGSDELGSSKSLSFLLECLLAASMGPGYRESAIKLVLPRVPGHVVRSDIIPMRLVDCPMAARAVSFSESQQFYTGKTTMTDAFEWLTDAFAASAAGIALRTDASSKGVKTDLLSLEIELCDRLSFPWLTESRRPQQTLAMFCGPRHSPAHGSTGNRIFPAAKALGIDIVVLDFPGHWLQQPEYAHLCKAFIPIDVERDAALPGRILAALSSYGKRIDGIVTFFESYTAAVATVAAELSLPTASPEAFEIVKDKYKTSVFEGHRAYRASSIDEAINIAHETDLSYPLIVKPCRGWLSEGVTKVEHASEFADAINAIDTSRHSSDFVIEEYCDGPEVDANLILCDGELLLFEVSDDFPKSADVNGTGTLGTFIELANVFPSKLPANELGILRKSLHASLLRLGLRSGIFHLEARIKDSTMEYVLQDGILDLEHCKAPRQVAPSAWLLEINPRPPGIQASDAVAGTYGIDYWGLGLLFALNDKERARALSHPFANGPQYWCEIVFVPVEFGGTFDSDDVCDDLLQRRPDLALHVSEALCFFKRGEQVPSPKSGLNAWIAYFNVYSRTSRAHVLRIAEEVRNEIRFSVI